MASRTRVESTNVGLLVAAAKGTRAMYSKGSGHTDVGRKRDQNEDAVLVDDDLGLYVVSDGMGGHAAGEVASATAIATVGRSVAARREHLQRVREGQLDREAFGQIVKSAVLEAAQEIYELATSSRGQSGMGCTLTALVVAGPVAAMAHVGDSRLYLFRDGGTSQLTTDHTLAHELVKVGFLKPGEERDHPHAHVLTRSVGTQRAVEVDTLVFDVLPGDRLLLCSDGLGDYIESSQWLDGQLGGEDVDVLAEELVSYANQAGGKDNITALVVSIEARAPGRTELREHSKQVHGKLEALDAVFLFDSLPLAMRTRVLERCTVEAVDEGVTIVEQGSPCDCLFVVMEGRCRLTRSDSEMARLGPGEYVGLTALLNDRPARASLEAVEPSKLLRLSRKSFWQLVKARPWLGVGLLERMGRRLSQSLDQAVEEREGGPAARLAGERF